MASSYKVLGQSAPGANTWTDLYTVPVSTSVVCSSLVICNRGTSASFRIAVRPNGAGLANSHYIVYDNWVNTSDSIFMTVGLTMDASDVVSVYSSSAELTFSLYGNEIT